MAILLGEWGVTDSIELDLDGDGIVGAGDMAIVLGLWGTTELKLPCSGEFCVPTGGEQSAEYVLGGQPFETALAAFGFESVEDFVAWGLRRIPSR